MRLPSRQFSQVSVAQVSIALVLGACAGVTMPMLGASPAFAVEQAVPAEKNPPGDIPDTQVFIDYTSPLGFSVKVPEGWARSDLADGVGFVDKLDGVAVSVAKADAAPTAASADTSNLSLFGKPERAVKVSSIKAVRLPAGQALRIVYTSNSEPNAVTSRQVRLENERYLFFRNGKLATLEFFAPKGADNVDQWQLMSNSFRWN